MLRIAVYYENRMGRNDGNPLYVLMAMRRIQYYGSVLTGRMDKNKSLTLSELQSFGFPSSDPDLLAYNVAKKLLDTYGETIEIDHLLPTGEIQAYGKYDLNIDVDWGEDGLVGILPYTPIKVPSPRMVWNSDTHLGYEYRLKKSLDADYVFCAQKRACEEMKRDGVKNSIWLPHAVEPLAYPKYDLASKKYDVCFVGHVNSANRLNALDRLFREFPNFYYGQRRFDDAARKFSESKIGFNIHMLDDINMRDFEVMATGTMLLTNWIPTIEEVFSNGNDLVLYRDEEEMVEKARFYIEHENEREEIAKTGYEKVIKNHTIIHRVEKMLDAYCAKNCKVIGGVEGSTPSPSSPSNINDIGKEGENKICVKNEKGEIK